MILTLLAAAAAASACPGSPAGLLDANRRAVMAGSTQAGAATARYAYSGQGMTGTTAAVFDLATGHFVDSFTIGPTRGSNGYDGRSAWQQDLSGAYMHEGGGDRLALGVNEAYRNANLWWRADRGGATIAPLGCDGLRVTPRGGKVFDAWFDPATHQLVKTREVQGFSRIETGYAGYSKRGGRMVAGMVTVDVDGDTGSRQTMRLTDFAVAAAQPMTAYAMPVVRLTDWSIPGGRVTLPMRLLNNHVFVDVKVDGKGPFPFIIDTGGHNIVTPHTVAQLGLRAVGDALSGGAGDAKVSNGYTRVRSLDAGGALVRELTVVTLDFSPRAVEGFDVGGMLGLEFLQRFVMRIDYGANTVTFIDPARFGEADRRAAGTAIPFEFYDHMPHIRGKLGNRPALFNIDTGSRSDVTMTAPAVARDRLRQAYPNGVTVTEGWGVGGPSRSYVVRADSLTLGTVQMRKPIVGLSSAKGGAFSDANYDGNIGSGLLKRYVVTFDYSRQTMYLKPVAKPDADASRFDRTGMWINLADRGVEVKDVADGGPAAAAGIKVGDVVTAIGGESVAGKPLSDVRRRIKLVPIGQPLAVAYLRGGEGRTTTLTPRDLIPD